MPTPPGGLRHIADALDAEARELDRARLQETKPKHLWVHARRAAIHATRRLLAAVDSGADLLGPFRPVGGDCQLVKLDRRNDEALLGYWQHFAVTWLRSKCPDEFAPDAGAFDFPAFKTDAKGQLLGRNGKPLRWSAAEKRAMKRALQPGVGLRERVRVFGEVLRNASKPASVVDDYDEADTLSHLRAQARDWAAACRAAASLVREQASSPSVPNPLGLDHEDIAILTALEEASPRLCDLYDLEEASRISRKTIGRTLGELIGKNLAARPNGPRKGATITDDGRLKLQACGPPRSAP